MCTKKNLRNIPKIRRRWVINPRSRIKDNIKKYKRTKRKGELKEILKGINDEESA